MRLSEKQIKLLETYFKALANKKRIAILALIEEEANLTVFEIAERLGLHYQTAAVHTQRLEKTGLIQKKYRGTHVVHRITKRGKSFLSFASKILR